MPDMRSFADAVARHGKQIAGDAAKSAVQSALSGNGSDSSSGDAAAGGAGDMAAAAVSGFIGKKKSGAISAASMEDSQGRFDELTEGLGTSLDAVDAAGIGAAKRGSAFGSREGGNAAKGARKPDMRKSFGTAKDSRALAKKALHGTRGAMQEGGVESAAVGSMFTAVEEAGADSAAGAAVHASTRLAAMGPGAAGRRAKGGPGAGRALRNAAFEYFDGMTDDGISDVTSDIKTAYAGYRTTAEGAKLARAGVRTAGKGVRAVGRAAASAPGSAVKLGRAVVGAPDRVAASARAAKEKSMAIAKAVREGRIITGMGTENQIKAMDVARKGLHGAGTAMLTLLRGLAAQVVSVLPLLTPVLVLVLGVAIVSGVIGAAASLLPHQVQGLTDDESYVCNFFHEKGLPDIQIAAIMGNMRRESGFRPDAEEGGSAGMGIGLCQWSRTSHKDGSWGPGRRKKLMDYAESQGKPWQDIGVQMDFFWNHDIWGTGWSGGAGGAWNEKRFMETKDLDEATECFARGWERPSASGLVLDLRRSYAKTYYDAITSPSGGSGEEYQAATAAQKGVVDAAKRTPSPGNGLCAKWVSQTLTRAGYAYQNGNANDMYNNCCTSSNRNDLKVGMLIAVPRHPHTSAGRTYGHVGIYIGDNQVMDNVGTVRTISLDEWINYYDDMETPKWGWATVTGDLSAK